MKEKQLKFVVESEAYALKEILQRDDRMPFIQESERGEIGTHAENSINILYNDNSNATTLDEYKQMGDWLKNKHDSIKSLKKEQGT